MIEIYTFQTDFKVRLLDECVNIGLKIYQRLFNFISRDFFPISLSFEKIDNINSNEKYTGNINRLFSVEQCLIYLKYD